MADRIVITGAGGQVGRFLAVEAGRRHLDVLALTSAQWDITDADAAQRIVKGGDLVVNCAAFTAVDAAESEPERAHAVNAAGPGAIARACATAGARMIHISTDYVFSGSFDGAPRPYDVADATGPLSVYGKTKLAGEQAIADSGCDHLVLRTAWVYGARGQNFLLTALKLARERDEIRIVNDQVGSPTPARWLAAATALALARRFDAQGTWHVVADGECSWHGFAQAILGDALVAGVLERSPKVLGIPSSEFPTKARRPAYSRLDSSRFARDFDLRLPDWRVGLREVIAEIAEVRSA